MASKEVGRLHPENFAAHLVEVSSWHGSDALGFDLLLARLLSGRCPTSATRHLHGGALLRLRLEVLAGGLYGRLGRLARQVRGAQRRELADSNQRVVPVRAHLSLPLPDGA